MSSSFHGRIASRMRRRPFDRDVAILGLLVGVCLLPLRFVLSHLFAETLPVVIILASALYLLAYRGSTQRGEGGVGHALPTIPRPATRFMPAMTFGCVATLIVLATFQGTRSPAFYAIAAVGGSMVLAQIFFGADDDVVPGLVLVQILVLAATIRFAALYTTAGFIGIDIWTHLSKLAVDLKETGSLAAMRDHASRGAKYYASPLYHLLVVSASLFGGLALESALHLTVGVGLVAALALVYETATRTVPARWALAATALFAFSDHAIKWSIHLIPTSLGLLFFLAGFYYFVRTLQGRNVRDVALLVFFIVALTLSHQVSAFIMLVTIGTAAVVQYVVTSDFLFPDVRARDLSGLFVFQIGLLTLVWSLTPYRGGTFAEVMIEKLRTTLVESAGLFNLQSTPTSGGSAVGEQTPSLVDQFIPYIDVLGFMLLLGITFIGCLYALRSERTTLARLLLIFVVAIMIAFALFLPIMGVGLFLPGRWFAFMYLPMAALGALGLGYLGRNLNPNAVTVVLLVLALAYPAAMFVSTDATIDSPVFDHDQPRFSYTEPELEAVSHFDRMVDEDQPVYTDLPYAEVFRRTEANPRATMMAVNPNTSATPDQLVVYREYQTQGAPIFDIGAHSALYPVEQHDVCGPERSKLYSNGQVTMCYGADSDAVPDDAGSSGNGTDDGSGGSDGGSGSGGDDGSGSGGDGRSGSGGDGGSGGDDESIVSMDFAAGVRR